MGILSIASRNLRQLLFGGYAHSGTRLAFIHVPKCGGTSLDSAIRTALGPRAQVPGKGSANLDPVASLTASQVLDRDYRDYCEDLLPYFLAKPGLRYISGHWTLRDSVYSRYSPEWDFALLLRDPAKRWISQYFFNRYKTSDHFRISEEIGDFIHTDRGRSYGCVYVRYLAPDQFNFGSEPSAAVVDTAIGNLKRYRLLGVLEDLESMAGSFRQAYGARLRIPHSNKNPVSADDARRAVSAEEMEAIENICRPDREIYDAALSMISSRS